MPSYYLDDSCDVIWAVRRRDKNRLRNVYDEQPEYIVLDHIKIKESH
jgi:hypothetical protein